MTDSPVVFLSYSREDEEWRRRFVTMLEPVVRERRLEVWSDDRLLVGERWRPQLEQAIGRSRAALALVSPDFLASEFVVGEELPALLRQGTPLVCVLVRACLWQHVEILRDVQWAHDPRGDGPVASAAHPEGQIVRVCDALLATLAAPAHVEAPERRAGTRSRTVAALTRAREPGRLDGVPGLPLGYVAREELAGLRAALLGAGEGAVAITGNVRVLGLHGQGGIGKTVLAAALAHDDEVRRHFPDGLVWLTLGERGDLVRAQLELLARLGAPHSELRSAAQGVALLRSALVERQCLLVIDDVWSRAAVDAFRATGPWGRVLYTTRDARVLPPGADIEPIDVLSENSARALLAALSGVPVDALPAAANSVLERTGRGALALALIGAAIGRGGRPWDDVVSQLERGARTFLEHPYANTFKAMQVALAALDEPLSHAYRSLAVYPEDTLIPTAAVARVWAHLWGLSTGQTEAWLSALAARELLTLESGGLRLHDLQRGFLLLQASELTLAHADLLSTYRALLADGAPWSRLPPGEPYIWEQLTYHLRGAGDAHAILATVADLGYLAVRTFRAGPYAGEADLRHAAELTNSAPAIAWLLRLFTQWGHLLADHSTVGNLAATLASRTGDAPPSVDRDTLAESLPEWFLVPRWGLPTASQALDRVLEGHSGSVSAVAFAPGGGRLATAGSDGTVRLWDVARGRAITLLEGHRGPVSAVVFAPDGRRLASAGRDGTVRLWDAASGQVVGVLGGHSDWVNAVAFSPDGHRLASASHDGTVRVWDAARHVPDAKLTGHTGPVTGVAFSPDGGRLASASRDGTLRLWNSADGVTAGTLTGHSGSVSGIAFSSDGRRLASASRDGTLRLWDSAGGAPSATLEGHADWVSAIAFSPDGCRIASTGDDGTVRLWDAASGEPTAVLEGHNGPVNGVAYSPDGSRLASVSDDGTVRLWDAARAETDAARSGHGAVNDVAYSPDGRLLASAGADGTVRVWDVAGGEPTATFERHNGPVNGVAFSPYGLRLASAGSDATVRLWGANGWPIGTCEGHSGAVNGVVFSPDGSLLASIGTDRTLRTWRIERGEPASEQQSFDVDLARGMAFSPDGKRLVSTTQDGTVRLSGHFWPRYSRVDSAISNNHLNPGHRVAYSPDGRRIASASDDGTVRLWDASTQQPTASLNGHAGAVTGVAFSRDGGRLASAGVDGTVRLWDVELGLQISQLTLGIPLAALTWGPSGVTIGARTGIVQLDVRRRSPKAADA